MKQDVVIWDFKNTSTFYDTNKMIKVSACEFNSQGKRKFSFKLIPIEVKEFPCELFINVKIGKKELIDGKERFRDLSVIEKNSFYLTKDSPYMQSVLIEFGIPLNKEPDNILAKINLKCEKAYLPPQMPPKVGLSNKCTNTCYMNSSLQILFHIEKFRKLIFSIRSLKSDSRKTIILYNLQRLFYLMQTSTRSIDTLDLRRSFGWSDKVALTQDPLEFIEKLLNNLSMKLYNPYPELYKELHNIFEVTEIKKREGGEDITNSWCFCLPISQKDNSLLKALSSYTKQCTVKKLPDVLNIILSSRENKMMHRFSVPETINLASLKGEKKDDHFRLVSIVYLIKNHYYACIKPLYNKWISLNDANVSEIDNLDMFRSNPLNNQHRQVPYILTYVRINKWSEIMCGIDDKNLPQNIIEDINKENHSKKHVTNQTKMSIMYYTENMLLNRKFEDVSVYKSNEFKLEYKTLCNENSDQWELKQNQIAEEIAKSEKTTTDKIEIWNTTNDYPSGIFEADNKSIKTLSCSERKFFVSKEKIGTSLDNKILLLFQYHSDGDYAEFIASYHYVKEIRYCDLKPLIAEKIGTDDVSFFILFNEEFKKVDPNQKKFGFNISPIFIQKNERGELNRKDISLVSGEKASYFSLLKEQEMTSLINYRKMQLGSRKIVLVNSNGEKLTIRIPKRITLSQLEMIARNAFNINSKDQSVYFNVINKLTKVPNAKNISSSVSELDENTEILVTSAEKKYCNYSQLIEFTDPSTQKRRFTTIPVKENRNSINSIMEVYKNLDSSVPNDLLRITISMSGSAAIEVKDKRVSANDYILRFQPISDEEKVGSKKFVRCFEGCYMEKGLNVCSTSETIFLALDDDDSEDAIKEKIIKKLNKPGVDFEIILVDFTNFNIIHDQPLTSIFNQSSNVLFAINPEIEFDDTPIRNQELTNSIILFN